MCGICGVLFFQGKNPDIQNLRRMCSKITHRGPDDEGQKVIGPVGLGMRRLSIIDLKTGHQPLSNEDDSVWIVFNGEIYNFQAIREELIKSGHRFKSISDTESIVHGYEAWGENVCQKLNGMFGFAIWDHRHKKLLLARDRIGIKPVYYYLDDDKLVFGSEIKAILQFPEIQKEIDLIALNNYLTFEYIPSPRSIFKKIRKLEPGHYLKWENGKINIEPYWKLIPKEKPWKEGEASERFEELLKDSVKLRLVSDVPLGAFLSGGLDSSIIVAHMAQLMDQPVKTFSIGFKESTYNELSYARSVAEKYHTEHYEFMLEAKALELTEKLIKHLDEPFGDFSIFPTYLVSKMARDYVTVTLSGDGGDELFAGYDTYRAHRFDRRYYHWLPKFIKNRILGSIADFLPPTEKKKGFINTYKRFIQGTELPKTLFHVRWMIFLEEERRKSLFSPEVYQEILTTEPYDFISQACQDIKEVSDITKTGYIDLKTYLVDDILVKVDRMSMATSLETRVPYLDHRLVEFAFTLPPELKMRGFKTKYLMKKTFKKYLPREVQYRDKQGFSIPIKNWLRNDLKSMMLDLLAENRLRQQGFFNPDIVKNMVVEHLEGVQNHSHLLWALMVFEQWYDLYAKT